MADALLTILEPPGDGARRDSFGPKACVEHQK